MKIELNNNKIFYKNGSSVQEIHPFWLRERANGEKYLDKKTQQRLFDPTSLNVEIAIKSARINNCLLYTSPSPRDATLSRMPSSA